MEENVKEGMQTEIISITQKYLMSVNCYLVKIITDKDLLPIFFA